MQYVPVLDKNNQPLMPCHPARARELLKKGRAVKRWFRGVFAIKLLDRSGGNVQPIACGIDPGSKREAFTVVSEKRIFLNVQCDAVTHIKDKLETRRNMRRARRFRKTPYRQPRFSNRSRKNFLPPSTRARWDLKLRIFNWLKKLYPIIKVVIEDIKAITKKNSKKWNTNFSPIEAGKKYFYKELSRLVNIELRSGYQTKILRDRIGLTKSADKMSDNFNSHCVDSYVLAKDGLGILPTLPDNLSILRIIPLKFYYRQLHKLQPSKGGKRSPYGSTRSLDFKRGSLIKHPKYGLCYVGGSNIEGGRISLHNINTGKRLCQKAYPNVCKFLTYLPWRWYLPLSSVS